MDRRARANVDPLRQRTQYTCMSASMCMALRALGVDCNEDEVNQVMGARPMKGASWESALACAQHYGMRGVLTVPATVRQLKDQTDEGIPVMIAWNPENRPWSHASLVFDVDNEGNVYVADPNIPDPEQTVRVVPKSEFYGKWYERWPDYLVRRPALAISREISVDGRQMVASTNVEQHLPTTDRRRIFAKYGPHAWGAWEEYARAVSNLEATADTVILASEKLKTLGIDPATEQYPLGKDIEAVASDIRRWHPPMVSNEDNEAQARVMTGYLRSKGYKTV